MQLIDAVSNGYLDRTLRLYDSAFPEDEKKPIQLILDKRRTGQTEILAIVSDSGDFLGEAITLSDGDIALLDYFAISSELRGGGIGSKALALLLERFESSRLILEIESTLLENTENSAQRLARKSFYLRAGLKPEDYTVELFGVEMELLSSKHIAFDEYKSLLCRAYDSICGGRYGENVKLI